MLDLFFPPTFQPPVTMWDRAHKSGGLYNPGRSKKKTPQTTTTTITKTTTSKSQSKKPSAAERKQQRAAASLQGTCVKAPLIPPDPALALNIAPSQQYLPERPCRRNQSKTPLVPDDPRLRAPTCSPDPPPLSHRKNRQSLVHTADHQLQYSEPFSPGTDSTDSRPRSSSRRRTQQRNYDEREENISITQKLVQEDSGSDAEYDDDRERRQGGFSVVPGDGDDDEDDDDLDDDEDVDFGHLLAPRGSKTPKTRNKRNKKVTSN